MHETVSGVCPITPWYSAVIVVVPQPVAVAKPALLIVAIETSLEAHVATLERSLLVEAGAYAPRAIN